MALETSQLAQFVPWVRRTPARGRPLMAQRPGATRARTTVRTTRGGTNGHAGAGRQKQAAAQMRADGARPLLGQRGPELQAFGTIAPLPNALKPNALQRIVADLNQILADTMTLRDLYK